MVGDIGRGIGEFMQWGCVMLCIFVPLGVWKLVDIVIWVHQHVNVTLEVQ